MFSINRVINPLGARSTDIQRNTQPSNSITFGISGLRSVRPKGMYIDMNAGKGCGSCARSVK